MEFVVQEAAQKVLDCELQKARQLRQKQVRQQASQWSEDRRRLFQEEKIRQKQDMAKQITEQVQEYAKSRIEHLLTAHDLAVAEVGAAHRAAAHLRQVEADRKERCIELQAAADERGNAAIREALKVQKKKDEMRTESLHRREQVRKEEDRKAKEMLEKSRSKLGTRLSGDRLPLSNVANTVTTRSSSSTMKDQSSANRLKYPGKVQHTPSKPKFLTKPKKHGYGPTTPSRTKSVPSKHSNITPTASAFDRAAKNKSKVPNRAKGMLRYTSTSTVVPTSPSKQSTTPTSTKPSTPGLGKQKAPASGSMGTRNGTSTVRYFDTRMPRPETNYTAPTGLVVRENGHHGRHSPDAWNKADAITKLSMQEVEQRAKQQEELLRRTEERGKVALEKARLEKKLITLKTELLSGEGADAQTSLGTGRQISLLDLEDDVAHPRYGDHELMSGSDAGSEHESLDKSHHRTLKKFKVNDKPSGFGVDLTKSKARSKGKTKTKPTTKEELENDQLRSEKIASEIVDRLESDIEKLKKQMKVLSQNQAGGVPGSSRIDAVDSSSHKQASKPKSPRHTSPHEPPLLSPSPKKPGIGKKNDPPKSDQVFKLGADSDTSSLTSDSTKFNTTAQQTDKKEDDIIGLKTPVSTDQRRIIVPKKSRGSKEKIYKKRDERLVFSPSHESIIVASDEEKGVSESTPISSADKLITIRSAKKTGDKPDFLEMSSINTTTSASITPDISPGLPIAKKHVKLAASGDKSVGHGPDGPYTSTPEGNLVLKKPSSRSVAVAVSRKDLMLHHIVSGFLTRRMESIELMPVSSSSSSDLHVDSSLITRSPSSTGASSSFHSPFNTTASSAHTSTENKSTTSHSSLYRTRTYENLLRSHTLITATSTTTDTDAEHDVDVSLKKTIKRIPGHKTDKVVASTTTENSGTGGSISSGSTLAEATVRTIIESTSGSSYSTSANQGTTTDTTTNTSNGAVEHTPKSQHDLALTTTSTNSENSTLHNINLVHDTTGLTNTDNSTATGGTTSEPTLSSQKTTSLESREIKRAAFRNLVGDINYADYLSPICPHKTEEQPDMLASIFDKLQEDFIGLMSIERPPWFV